jgi:hypothetical protein
MYYQSLTPPAIGTFQLKFKAHMVVDRDWNGRGGFSYGTHKVENVPVRSLE